MLHPDSISEDPVRRYERTRDRLQGDIDRARREGQVVGLRKGTSNLFRARHANGKHRIDAGDLRHVLKIDADRLLADVEGMTTYDKLVAETLRHGLLPAVTPELRTITVGGAVSGLGIESSSFRFGLVHETVEQMEVLLGNGSVMRCSRNDHSDLFYALPNSYGTLGYILRLTIRLVPARPCVCVTHSRYVDTDAYIAAVLAAAGDGHVDFLDGTAFDARELYVTEGAMEEHARRTSNYRHLHIYYRSIRERESDCLTTADYIWRWDTDWFWCSKQFHLQNRAVRFLIPPPLLSSATYQRLMRLSNRFLPASSGTESVIQDVAIPASKASAFLEFLLAEIPIRPIWVCPFRASDESPSFSLYPVDPGMYVNFGFWDVVPARSDPAYYNRKVERAAEKLGGRKALYSSSFYSAPDFWSLFDRQRYEEMKLQCDPDGLFGDLYAKCVRGQ